MSRRNETKRERQRRMLRWRNRQRRAKNRKILEAAVAAGVLPVRDEQPGDAFSDEDREPDPPNETKSERRLRLRRCSYRKCRARDRKVIKAAVAAGTLEHQNEDDFSEEELEPEPSNETLQGRRLRMNRRHGRKFRAKRRRRLERAAAAVAILIQCSYPLPNRARTELVLVEDKSTELKFVNN